MRKRSIDSVKPEMFRVLMLAAVAFAVMLPVLIVGLPKGHDLPHHYQCAMTFAESIRAGELYPSWSLNRNFGFGGMESRLYPPVSHYALALAHLVTGEWHLSSWFVFLLLTFAGALGVYLWARESMAVENAVFAGCFYTLLPYHLNQLYNTFFYAEFAGSAVLPFVFLFVSRVCRRGSAGDVALLGLTYALLILTHLPLTVIGSICFFVYALTLIKRKRIFSQTAKLFFGIVLALSASAFFWTKVLLERNLMAKASVYADPWLDYRLNFLLTPFQTYEGFELEVFQNGTYFYDLMLFYALLAALACTLPFFIAKRKFDASDKGVWVVFALAVFFTMPFSSFIWARVGLLQEVQFPWRWLAIISVAASVVAGSQFGELRLWFRSPRRPIALIITGCILAMLSFSLGQIVRQAPFIERDKIPAVMAKTQEDIGFTFWWPIWTRKPFADNRERVTARGRDVRIDEWTPVTRQFSVSEGEPLSARIAIFYHPNWHASVNGAAIPVEPDENGAVVLALPAGESVVSVSFREAPAVVAGQWSAVVGSLAIILLLTFQTFKNARTKSLPIV